MNLTNQHLAPIFDSITTLLGPAPDQLDLFGVWANEQALRLRRSADGGTEGLASESNLLRCELVLMEPVGRSPERTERTARMRMCQRLWLTGLIDFVDELLVLPSR